LAGRGTGVAEQIAEDVVQEVGEELGFLELVRGARLEEVVPVVELGTDRGGGWSECEGAQPWTQGVRAEERFGIYGHGAILVAGGMRWQVVQPLQGRRVFVAIDPGCARGLATLGCYI
jgi:hypothetical protein